MPAEPAGRYRRTPVERVDQRLSWERTDQAFFAAGACHVLAWTCRETYSAQPVGLAALRSPGREHVFHTYATWMGWAFDHSGWNPEAELLDVNARFEGKPLQREEVTVSLSEFCDQQLHQMPEHYWSDPWPRAREYVARYPPPWMS